MEKTIFYKINSQKEWSIAAQALLSTLWVFTISFSFNQVTSAIAALLGIICACIAQLGSPFIFANKQQYLISGFCFLIPTLNAFFFSSSPHLFLLELCLTTPLYLFLFQIVNPRFANIGFASVLMGIYILWGMRVYQQVVPLLLWMWLGVFLFYLTNYIWKMSVSRNQPATFLHPAYIALSELLDHFTHRFAQPRPDDLPLLKKQCLLNIRIQNCLRRCHFLAKETNTRDHQQDTLNTNILRQIEHFYVGLLPLMHHDAAAKTLPEQHAVIETCKKLAQQCRKIANNQRINIQLHTQQTQAVSVLSHQLIQCAKTFHTIEQLTFEKNQRLLQEQPTSIPQDPSSQRSSFKEHIRENLHLSSPVTRYALRMGLGLALSALAIVLNFAPNPEWTLISFWFVCRPTYSETHERLFQRTTGTFLGLLCSSLLLLLCDGIYPQILILALSLPLFFIFVELSYTRAVFFITLFAIFAYNLINQQALDILVPRMLHTLFGTSCAWFTTFFIWPQWQKYEISQKLSACLKTNLTLLNFILNASCKSAIIHRDLLNCALFAHQQLTLSWSRMQKEPKRKRANAQRTFYIAQTNLELISNLAAYDGCKEPVQRKVLMELRDFLHHQITLKHIHIHKSMYYQIDMFNKQLFSAQKPCI